MAAKRENFSPTNNINYLLRIYALNYNTYEIPFVEFLEFIHRYLEQEGKNEIVQEYSQNTERRVIEDLELLSYENRCNLEYINNEISKIFFPRYFLDRITKAYAKFEEDFDNPFPSDDSIGIALPPAMVTVINIKSDFINILGPQEQENPKIIRLLFPDQISSIVITSDRIQHKLLEYAVHKIKLYMDKQRNASYIENKIFPVFRQQGQSLREIINNIVVRTGQTVTLIKEPSDFSFRFWAHFANLVIQEYKKKADMLPQEHGFCQAAYLIGFYNIYYKGIQQKEKEKEAALKHFERTMIKEPYVYSLQDIYGFKDNNGYLLLKKYSKEYIHKILEDKTKPSNSQSLPEIIRFLTSNGRDYYVHKSSVLNLCFIKIYEASVELQKYYINQWIELLKHNKKSDIMVNDDKFLLDLTEKVHISYPVLAALLGNPNLLILINEEFPVKDKKSFIRLIDRTSNSLQPLNIVLALDRQHLLDEARSFLPFWETVPVVKWIIRILRKLFIGKKKYTPEETEKIQKKVNARINYYGKEDFADISKNSSPATMASLGQDQKKTVVPKLRANYKKAIASLKDHFVGKNDTTNSKLNFLMEKWNPLYDNQAKKNLVEDVNSMIRDYIRSLKRGFRVQPPDINRIEKLAAILVKNNHFSDIKKKDFLKLYIEVYMIKLLEENKF